MKNYIIYIPIVGVFITFYLIEKEKIHKSSEILSIAGIQAIIHGVLLIIFILI